MTQITFRLGAATALLASLPLLAACSTPDNALASRCSGGTWQGYDCTLTIERIDKPASGSLSVDKRNRQVDLSGTITLRTGKVDVTFGSGGQDDHTVTVTPDSPQQVDTTVRTAGRSSDDERLILVKVTPLEPSEGLEATLRHNG